MPSALRWPNGLDGGRKLTEPVGYIDVFPTLMRVAGASGHGGQPFDGEDAWDVIRGEKTRGDWFFHSYFQGQRIPQNSEPGRKVMFERNAVNSRRWKLVRLGPDMRKTANPRTDATLELYRIDEDISERRNLARQHPYIVEDLLRRMTAFRTDAEKAPGRSNDPTRPRLEPTSFAIPQE